MTERLIVAFLFARKDCYSTEMTAASGLTLDIAFSYCQTLFFKLKFIFL